MHRLAIGYALLAAILLAPGAAAKAQAPAVKRFLTLTDATIGDTTITVDAVVSEERRGDTIAAAELDICIPTYAGSRKLDHFVVPLAAAGETLSGSHAADKVPTSVSLEQTGTDKVSLSGKIRRGNVTIDVATDDLELAEDDPRSTSTEEANTTAQRDISPNVVSVDIPPARAPDLLRALKAQPVKVDANYLYPSCDELRQNRETIAMYIDPEHAAALMRQLRAFPGASKVQFALGDLSRANAVRFRPAGVAFDALAPRVAAAIGSALHDAPVSEPKKDEYTGEYVAAYRRPADLGAGAEVSELTEVRFLIVQDDTSREHAVVYLGAMKTALVPTAENSRLQFTEFLPGTSSQDDRPPGTDAILDTLQQTLGGSRWDDASEAWKD